MRNLAPLARREVGSIFCSPVAYVVAAVFLVIAGIFFPFLADSASATSYAVDLIWNQPADWAAHQLLEVVRYLLVFIAPLLTLRTVAEEQRTGSVEALLTAPVTDAEVIVSKWLGVSAFFLFMLALTGAYMGMIAYFGNPDWPRIMAHYLGVFLMGLLFLAIGVFCSSLTRSQVVAGVTALVLILAHSLAGLVEHYFGGRVGQFFSGMAPFVHLSHMQRGVVSSHNFVYFGSMTAFWLFAATRSLESRKWR